VLERVVQGAFRAAKAVRTETGIAEETVSIGSVAVELARRIFPSLADCRVLVFGAGKMGRVTARSLARHGVGEVVVTNRSFARAEALARELGWKAKPFELLDALLAEADVVLTCTGADRPVLDVKRLKAVVRHRKYKPLFLVDIAVPRDVEPGVGALENVYLYNIDDLEAVSRDHLKKRLGEAEKAERIVERVMAEVLQGEANRAAVPLVRAVRDHAAAIASNELDKALQRRLASLEPDEVKAVSGLIDAILNKLLHPTMSALRDERERRLSLAEATILLHGLDTSSPASGEVGQEPGNTDEVPHKPPI
jgi:glutamyl-tRNA reductase